MAHRPNLVCHLFLYGLWRKNDFNIFKWLKNNQKNNKLHKFHISVFIIRSCWDTAMAMGLHVIYGCFQLQQSWIVVAETIWLQWRKYLLSGFFFTKFADPWLKSECQSATGIRPWQNQKGVQEENTNGYLLMSRSRDLEAVMAGPPMRKQEVLAGNSVRDAGTPVHS